MVALINSRFSRTISLLTSVWIFFGGLPACSHAEIVYEIIDLGTLGGNFSSVVSINDAGQIVGEAAHNLGWVHATLFDATGAGNNIDLGTLEGGGRSCALSISGAGQIVGTAFTSEGLERATLFDPTGAGNNIDLGTLGGDWSRARSINNAGQIVGPADYGLGVWEYNACLFDTTGVGNNFDLGRLGGDWSVAYSINNTGQIVGKAQDSEGRSHATLFDPTGAGDNLDLGTLGGERSTALAINDSGRIVGWAENSSDDSRATLFDSTGAGNNVDLCTLGGDESGAVAVNEAGQIVGWAYNSQRDYRATLFDHTGAGNNIDLNTLIDPASGWTLISAHDINNSGWIVGNGINLQGEYHAFLLVHKSSKYGGGSGEPNDPYLITTGADLISISQNQGDWDKHFRLTADLDLTGIDLSDYTPIGTSQGSGDNYMVIPFQGIFDGNDHSIIGFTFSGYYTVGLFGIVDKGAYIMNLNLVDPNVQGWSWVGALVGELREATVAYCTIQGGRVSKPLDFRGSSIRYGGLIGCNSAGTVTMCHATCDVPAGNSRVGGLVGENLGIIQNCFATGTIGEEQIPRLHSGGLVGWNKGSITGCYATGDVYGEEYETGGLVGCNNGPVTHCHATGDVFGENGVGGLVGINRQEDNELDWLMGTIVDCYATGSVHVDGKGAGGLVGYNAGEISGSYATGRVNGKEDVGGLVGSNEYMDQGRIADSYASGRVTGEKHVGGLMGINSGTISRCYAVGSVSGFEQAGGLIGVNSQTRGGGRTTEGTVIACFWDIETSGQSSSAGGMGLFTPVMQNINPYLNSGWDFVDEIVNGPNDIWKMWDGYDYPRLIWEPGPNTPLAFVDINDPGFYGQMSKYEVTNAQYCDFLNAALASGDITVDGNDVYGAGGSNSGEDYIGQRYYRCDGSGYTGYGATNGGAARIHYSEGAFSVDEGFGNHPVTYVSWYGAMAFANYYGYYLPTEEQWQAVADYDGTYIYGCGQIIDPGIANYRDSEHPDGTTPVGSFGIYGYGMSDMAGNVWEWTSSSFLDSNRICGGSMGSIDSDCDISIRGDGMPYANYWDIGFRVCR